MSRTLPVTVAVTLLALLSSACSTIVKGTDQPITVATDPPGASCALDRSGTSVAVVNPTPGTVTVDKSKDPIAVTCTEKGYMTSTDVVDSDLQAMTFGNILFGGIIGVAVDASTGAMNEYPSSINVVMIPTSFSSSDARDKFFDNRVAVVEKDHDAAVKAADDSATCRRSPDGNGCLKLLAKIDKARDTQLAALDRQRAAALIQ